MWRPFTQPLAVVNVPLVIAALVLGLLRNYPAHREVAPFAFWIWIYVALTGLAIYGALYVF